MWVSHAPERIEARAEAIRLAELEADLVRRRPAAAMASPSLPHMSRIV